MPILVYLQKNGNTIHEGSLELCSKARELSKKKNMEVHGIYVGRSGDLLETEMKKTGLSLVHSYFCSESPTLEYIALAVVNCINLEEPDIVLFIGTLEGRSIAPTVAAYCKTGVTADCTELDLTDEGLLVQIRPAFGGDIMAEIHTPVARPQIATVRPGVFTADSMVSDELIVNAIKLDRGISVNGVIVEEIKMKEIQAVNNSQVIIAAGGGVKSKQDLDRLEDFCKTQGIMLMCSRSLVQRGWLPQNRQIGLSGVNVSSKLLITFGISGSVQFVSGIKHVSRIIAINTDKTAPVMLLADLPLLADLHEIISQL